MRHFINRIAAVVLFVSLSGSTLAQSSKTVTNADGLSNAVGVITINSRIDLGGKSVTLSPGCSINFGKGGQISNGKLVGDKTSVTAQPNSCIFPSGTILIGSWSATTAYSDWFDFKNDCVLDSFDRYVSGSDNYQQMLNLLNFNDVIFTKGVYYFAKSDFQIPSNTNIDGQGAIFKWAMTPKVSVFFNITKQNGIIVENIALNNFTIIGSKLESNIITEYYHGIQIRYGENITIDRVLSKYNRGDGLYIGNLELIENIDLSPKNIKITNSVFDENHRQGCSITRGRNIFFSDCQFTNTSGTKPAAGVDIEPNQRPNTQYAQYKYQCYNISFSKCTFTGNQGAGMQFTAYGPMIDGYFNIEKCSVTNCEIGGGIPIRGTKNIVIKNSSIYSKENGIVFDGNNIEDALVDNCRISNSVDGNEFSGIYLGPRKIVNSQLIIKKDITIRNCIFEKFGKCAILIMNNYVLGMAMEGIKIENNRFVNCADGLNIRGGNRGIIVVK